MSLETILCLLLCTLPLVPNPSESCILSARNGGLGNIIKMLPRRNGLILRNITDQFGEHCIVPSRIYLNTSDTEICTFSERFLVLSGLDNNVSCLNNNVEKSKLC